MRIRYLLFSCLIGLSSSVLAASEKPNRWICDLHGNSPSAEVKPPHVEISLKEPLLKLVSYVEDDHGRLKEKVTDLITATTVSSWKIKKKSCQLESIFENGEFVDKYDFNFSCGRVSGSMTMDFNRSEAYYGQSLNAGGSKVKYHLTLENCRSL